MWEWIIQVTTCNLSISSILNSCFGKITCIIILSLSLSLWIFWLITFYFLLQFFLELMKVPRVESKLRVFSFKIQFRTQVNEHLFNLFAFRCFPLWWFSLLHVWHCLALFQVSDLRKNLNIVNSVADEASILSLIFLYISEVVFLNISSVNNSLLIFITDQKFG